MHRYRISVAKLSKQNNKRFFSDNHFYKLGESSFSSEKQFVSPIVFDNSIDIEKLRPGETINSPYELTISPSFKDFWHSSFYCHDRINTSTPFGRSLGLQDQVLPFSLILFLATSMSHSDQAKLIAEYKNARYHWPVFAGDTVKKRFVVREVKLDICGKNSYITIECLLKNQRGVTVFSCDKTMMFPGVTPSDTVVERSSETSSNKFMNHLIQQADVLREIGSQTFSPLRPGQLILHSLTRPFSLSQSMELSSLARLTHERVFNTQRFQDNELYVPAGLVLSLTTSISSRDLHEVLFEELEHCHFPNSLHPGDTVGALTFIESIEEHVTGDIESAKIRTIGFKNMDVLRTLRNVSFPIEVFQQKYTRSRDFKSLVQEKIPELSQSIVCVVDRVIYRQTAKQAPFLL